MFAAKSVREYLKIYAEQHRERGTKVTHFFGIPLIVASLPVLPFIPLLAGSMFVGGWALQFIGHWVFEKNKPAFFSDPLYLLVGPIWVLLEIAELCGIKLSLTEALH